VTDDKSEIDKIAIRCGELKKLVTLKQMLTSLPGSKSRDLLLGQVDDMLNDPLWMLEWEYTQPITKKSVFD